MVVMSLAGRWEQECHRDFTEWVRERLPGIPDDVDPLNLAVAFFTCVCNPLLQTHLRWPTVLGHKCLRRADNRLEPVTTYFDKYKQELRDLDCVCRTSSFGLPDGTRWPLDPSTVSDGGFQIILQLLDMLGLDPCRTTLADLEAHPGRLIYEGPWYDSVWNWSGLVGFTLPRP